MSMPGQYASAVATRLVSTLALACTGTTASSASQTQHAKSLPSLVLAENNIRPRDALAQGARAEVAAFVRAQLASLPDRSRLIV